MSGHKPPSWSDAKPILLPYEGCVSQIYVLDLLHESLPAVIEVFREAVTDPTVGTLDGYTDEPRPWTDSMRDAILSSIGKSTHHALHGVRLDREWVSLFVWLDAEAGTFDAEIVFRANELFPEPDNDLACAEKLQDYIAWADRLRIDSPGSACVLTERVTGDPRDDRGSPWTCWW